MNIQTQTYSKTKSISVPTEVFKNSPLLMNGHVKNVRKRNGRIVFFDITKIAIAVYKAFLSEKEGSTQDAIKIASEVYLKIIGLTEKEEGFLPTVEGIQDLVEEELIVSGFTQTAKGYILYRQEHAKLREQKREKLLAEGRLKVQKRDGSLVRFNIAEIRRSLVNTFAKHSKKLNTKEVVAEMLEEIRRNVFDGITTKEINEIIIFTIRARIERDTIFTFIASRILLNDLYKDILGIDEESKNFIKIYRESFEKKMREGVKGERYDKRLLDFDFKKLTKAIVPERDMLLNYLGAETLRSRYLVEDYKKNILETPQYFWMRVAMGLSLLEKNKEEKAIEFYNLMSQFLYLPSTPTLFQSATRFPQLSSCYLNTVPDDLSAIFKTFGDNAQLSKYSGGVGTDWTSVRATGALIKTTNVGSQGVIPFLKIYDATTSAINRSGKRRGAACIYLETWHYDLESFLELRKNTGDDRRRTHDTNTANWIPDLFMKRVIDEGDWTLFSPDETPDLHDLYGKAFEKRYKEYEKMVDEGKIRLFKKTKAQDLWRKMITMLYETGHPWMVFKDACNIRSPQDHIGVVHSSNLCTEITLNTSKDETAVCNLGSVNLVKHLVKGKIDKKLLANTVRVAMRMLDNVIDINFYPTVEARNSNLRHRPVGLGVMGLTDSLLEMGIAYDTAEAVDFSDRTQELISYNAIYASSLLAKEKGKYKSFDGSKWSRGIFPHDTVAILEKERGLSTGINKKTHLDWKKLKTHVKKYGMRNSNTMAIAPTSNLANVAGCVAFSIEPIFKNLFVKSNVVGEFTVLNHYLVEELKSLKMWDATMLARIKQSDGSVQGIKEIPAKVKRKYKESFEVHPSWLIIHAATRGKWIDQSQSLNIFTRSTSGSEVGDIYIEAWKRGLKSTYYLRTVAASGIEKSTAELGLTNGNSDDHKEEMTAAEVNLSENPLVCDLGEDCEACQ